MQRDTITIAWMYDAKLRNGNETALSCYADTAEEAEETARDMCRMIGAEYIGGLTKGREVKL